MLGLITLISWGCTIYVFDQDDDKNNSQCDVDFIVEYFNLSSDEVYMGSSDQPAETDRLASLSSRQERCSVSLNQTAGYEELHMVECYVRSLDRRVYLFNTYTICPKDWLVAVNPNNSKRSTLSLHIAFIYDGSRIVVTAQQL